MNIDIVLLIQDCPEVGEQKQEEMDPLKCTEMVEYQESLKKRFQKDQDY